MLSLIINTLYIAFAIKIYNSLTMLNCKANKCLVGKTAIVTGGNSGLGFETALNLASRGCRVIIADIADTKESERKLKEESGNANIIGTHLDLGSLRSVRRFVDEVLKTEDRLDILVNNAGCAGLRGYTEDGLQKVMQINYFGHFLLTNLLVDLLIKSKGSRVVFVSSALAFLHTLDSPKHMNTEPRFPLSKLLSMTLQYSNSKLCLLIAAKKFAEKLDQFGVSCYSVHPGGIRTKIYSSSFKNSSANVVLQELLLIAIRIGVFFIGKSVRDGAQTTLHCALSDDVEGKSGEHFWNGVPFWQPPAARNEEFCSQLWDESERLVKLNKHEKLL